MSSSSDPKLANRILRGLAFGLVAGVLTLGLGKIWPPALAWAQTVATQVLEPFGQVFLRLLFFVIIPLVFASLAAGVVQLGRPEKLGPLAGKTFFFFFLNMGIAVALGLIVMNLVQPGDFISSSTKESVMAAYGGAAQKHVANQQQAGLTLMSIVEIDRKSVV